LNEVLETTTADGHRVGALQIALPPPSVSMSQDREWCVVKVDGAWKQIRFHDYDEIYQIPGLYEALFYDVLGCTSPTKIREILQRCVDRSELAPEELKVLDLGAGNGMVGEQLAELGVRRIVGVDIIPAAAAAMRRDREEFYDDYFVLDMTSLSDRDKGRLAAFDFNGLTCVAALGFGDIPPAAFANAYNLIRTGGQVAFNIKSDFLEAVRPGGFAGLIRRMIDNHIVDLAACQQYTHRLATNGDPLLYTAFACSKKADIPASWEF
jgi:SAM-dependent methyltransferase